MTNATTKLALELADDEPRFYTVLAAELLFEAWWLARYRVAAHQMPVHDEPEHVPHRSRWWIVEADADPKYKLIHRVPLRVVAHHLP